MSRKHHGQVFAKPGRCRQCGQPKPMAQHLCDSCRFSEQALAVGAKEDKVCPACSHGKFPDEKWCSACANAADEPRE